MRTFLRIFVLSALFFPTLALPAVIDISKVRDAYKLLGYGEEGPTLDLKTLKKRRNELLNKFHPDKNPRAERAESIQNGEMTARISDAFDLIEEARKRGLERKPKEGSGTASILSSTQTELGPGIVPFNEIELMPTQVFENAHGHIFLAEVNGHFRSKWFWRPKNKPIVSRIIINDQSGRYVPGLGWVELRASMFDPRLPNGQIPFEISNKTLKVGEFSFAQVCAHNCSEWVPTLVTSETLIQFNSPTANQNWRSWNYQVYRGPDAYYITADPEYFHDEWDSDRWFFRLFVVPYTDNSNIGEITLKYDRERRLSVVSDNGNLVGFNQNMLVKERLPIFDTTLKLYLGECRIQDDRARLNIYSPQGSLIQAASPATAAEVKKLRLINLLRIKFDIPDKLSTPLDPRFDPFNERALTNNSLECSGGLLGSPK